ncbi:serine/threonine protein kinase [Solihabitans fulvus]|uniref:non-specific serine/threonine protein kinase n=1 Tax=Solihabitans fulvus TaxID=1892852 RepID=A0A5B2XGF5_9PSEU|nr:serine/threonine-protein kinase [Solihabitans fulvus]KAA2262433.1 serine/threonine protein kinase [Solihabitans fulvus]
MSDDLTGRRLGHYRIDGVLGRGGMAIMYKATDVRLGRKVALKVIGEHLTGDPEFRERFVDEARNTSAIDHSNVVPLYDFGEIDGLLYIAMRLVDGSDLASLIKDGPISPARTLTLLAQVAEALDMLHDRGLVHLDVKPANVLVTSRESASEHVYLADFGLTRRGATGHRTSSGDFLGSPTYAAPEHLRGDSVDGRTDAYSLACMLFACLTGRPPFKGGVQEVIQGHLGSEVPSLTALVMLPSGIEDVMRRGMAKDPNQRYGTCRELIAAARSALSAVARPGTPPPPRRQDPGQSGSHNAAAHASGQHTAGQHPSTPQTGGQPALGYPQQRPQEQPRPVAPQPTYQQQPPSYQQRPSQSDPVRLRPPAAVGSSAFTSDSDGPPRWLVPVIVGITAIVVIVVLVVVLSNSG